jgi:hypothetical protein
MQDTKNCCAATGLRHKFPNKKFITNFLVASAGIVAYIFICSLRYPNPLPVISDAFLTLDTFLESCSNGVHTCSRVVDDGLECSLVSAPTQMIKIMSGELHDRIKMCMAIMTSPLHYC